jgi:hypothetical protein
MKCMRIVVVAALLALLVPAMASAEMTDHYIKKYINVDGDLTTLVAAIGEEYTLTCCIYPEYTDDPTKELCPGGNFIHQNFTLRAVKREGTPAGEKDGIITKVTFPGGIERTKANQADVPGGDGKPLYRIAWQTGDSVVRITQIGHPECEPCGVYPCMLEYLMVTVKFQDGGDKWIECRAGMAASDPWTDQDSSDPMWYWPCDCKCPYILCWGAWRTTVSVLDLKAFKRDGTTEVAEDKEEDPGAYVAYNNDDDDADGGGTQMDKDDNDIRKDTVGKEDDTIKVKCVFGNDFATMTEGKVVLKRADTKIKLWKKQSKEGAANEIVFNLVGNTEKVYDLSVAADRTAFNDDIRDKELWLEGFDVSTALKDTSLKLIYRDGGDSDLASDLVKLTVFPIWLKTYKWDAAELTMDKEDTPGNFIAVNNDDDDGNNVKDIDDPGHASENDLQKVRFEFGALFSTLQTGKVVIERNGDNLKLWKQSTKGAGNEIEFTSNKKVYDLTDSQYRADFVDDILNKDLFVEGAVMSNAERDTTFTLKFVDTADIDVCKDPVKYTVFKIDLDVNNDGDLDDAVDGAVGYMPGEEAGVATITFNTTGTAGVVYTAGQAMHLVTEPADGNEVTGAEYTITACSDEPGFCMNSTAVPDTNDDDYSFNATAEDKTETVGVGDGRSVVAFYCKDFGGYCTVRTRVKKGANTIFEFTRTIPSDGNNNHCGDAWAGNKGPGASEAAIDDNDDDPAGNGTDGDMLSRYQEYRGFIVQGMHVRTSPVKKDVFIRDIDGLGPGDFTTVKLGAPVHYIRANEWNPANRFVNERNETSHANDCMSMRVEDGGAGAAGVWGETQRARDPRCPNNNVFCRLYMTSVRGVAATLTADVKAGDANIPVNFATGWAGGWAVPGRIRVGGEDIPYTGVAANAFTGCTIAANHARNSTLGHFADVNDFVARLFAHESGHVVGMPDMGAGNCIMTEPAQQGGVSSTDYWHVFGGAIANFRVHN